MSKFQVLLFALSPLLAHGADQDAPWVLSFSDEFDRPELDLSRWTPHDPGARIRDRQQQKYAPDAVSVSGGQLHLVARRDEESGGYRSGIVSTFGLFAQTYGRFEIRCRVPQGRGLRPGFLLLPVPSGYLPGIDIFETLGSAPSRVFFANRWGNEQTERSYGDSFAGPDLSDGFHTLSVEWESDRIAWYVDGKLKFRSTDGVPHQPLYLLLDLAVGGSLARPPDDATRFPASFDIDYIRVYKHPQQ